MMGNGQPSGDSRWGAPEPAISFTNNGEGNEAPGVGGTFFDASGEEIDGGFGGGGSGARWAAGGAGGYSGLKRLTEVKGRLAAMSVSKNTKIVARSSDCPAKLEIIAQIARTFFFQVVVEDQTKASQAVAEAT